MSEEIFDTDIQNTLLEILGKIKEGKVALFLGAGITCSVGGPSGSELSEKIKSFFPNIDQNLTEFMDICQDVIETPPYNRNELEEFIRDIFKKLQPGFSHSELVKYNWGTIFTTNFDDLVELSYRQFNNRRSCYRINTEKFQVNIADRTKIYLFKIMGCMEALEKNSSCMVLTRSDYNKSIITRQEYFNLLSDFVKNGTMLFIGYSFKDRIVLEIMDELKQIYGEDRLPWSYAIFKDIQLDKKEVYKFSSRKIIPIKGSVDDVLKFFKENYNFDRSKRKHINIKIDGQTINISDAEFRQLSEHFIILNESKINEDPGNMDDFFKGINNRFSVFKEKWDFQRDIYYKNDYKRVINNRPLEGCIKSRVFNELRNYNVEGNTIIIITGMAGIGKTVLLRRLAYDVYTSGIAPVIFIKSSRTNFDYRLLSSFIEKINFKFNEKIPLDKKVNPIKPLIIFDDASAMLKHVSTLNNYLASRGRSALIVAASRKNEWEAQFKDHLFKIPMMNIFEVEETLDAGEKEDIIKHLFELKYITSRGIRWDEMLDKEFENSFFATIYTLVDPAKRSLNQIIKDQYLELDDFTQRLFRNICLFHQFNVSINIELLVRSLEVTYETFYEIVKRSANKVIFEEIDEDGNILYRTHHSIIARRTIEFFQEDAEAQKEAFIEIFEKCNFSNIKERLICEKVLVDYIGPKSKIERFTATQQRDIFSTVCNKYEIRTILHHWGIIENDDNNFEIAERLLRRALELPKDSFDSYRGESDQNILTTIGTLYSKYGMWYLRMNKDTEANDSFSKAERYFMDARSGEFPNTHAYHANAFMKFQIGTRETDKYKRMVNFAQAIEIIETAKDNLNPEDQQIIYELENKIWLEMNEQNEHISAHYIQVLRDQFNSPQGYYIFAQHLLRNLDGYGDEEVKKEKLKKAYNCINEALQYFSNDESCLCLKAKILIEMSVPNKKEYYDVLNKWKLVSTRLNAWLLYELGRISFILGYYDFSRNYFNELQSGVGVGHKLRTRPRFPIKDEHDQNEFFEGKVTELHDKYTGKIVCETLRNLRYPIFFRPLACTFTAMEGDMVRFNIAFSYLGASAVNIEKL